MTALLLCHAVTSTSLSIVKCHSTTTYTVFLSAAYCIEYRSDLPPDVIPDGIHSKTTTIGRVKWSQLYIGNIFIIQLRNIEELYVHALQCMNTSPAQTAKLRKPL